VRLHFHARGSYPVSCRPEHQILCSYRSLPNCVCARGLCLFFNWMTSFKRRSRDKGQNN
jgi:hypothetical protein